MKDEDILKEAHEAFDRCVEAEADYRREAEDDLRFVRLHEHWPEKVKRQRELEGKPCLVIPRLPGVINQIVNDGRMNKPSITVSPAEDGDVEVANVYSGLIRHIEQASKADDAYDTAFDFAVSCGLGYFRINTKYPRTTSPDLDLVVEAVPDPFSVYGDPDSTACDSSDWSVAFVCTRLRKSEFKRRYPKAKKLNFQGDGWSHLGAPWRDDDHVMVAEYWTREESSRPVVFLSDGQMVDADDFEANREMYDASGVFEVARRDVPSHSVTQRIISGAEVLETRPWAGSFIPIIPVWGNQHIVLGKRYAEGIVRPAKDAQRMVNYWRSASTELVALAPKAPWVGPVGAFETDAAKWATANVQSHAYIEYDGDVPPQRQPFAGVPAGAIQEALNAADDIKAITSIYDASLGARSNETSGKAIMARQREGDVGTFHFTDNLTKAIRHAGYVLLDLIPKVYTSPRMLRILGPDGSPALVPVNQSSPVLVSDDKGNQFEKVFDLTVGEFDLVVKSGPSFTTRREEAATQMIELMRANPSVAPVLGDLIAQNLDWPGADEIARRMKALLPPQVQGQNPQIEEAKQAMAKVVADLRQTQGELSALQADKRLEAEKLAIERFKAETDRIEAEARIRDSQLQAFASGIAA